MLDDTAALLPPLSFFLRKVLFQNKSLLYKAATTGLHALCLAMTNCFWGAAVRLSIAFGVCSPAHSLLLGASGSAPCLVASLKL